jgi:hypothetical protein
MTDEAETKVKEVCNALGPNINEHPHTSATVSWTLADFLFNGPEQRDCETPSSVSTAVSAPFLKKKAVSAQCALHVASPKISMY